MATQTIDGPNPNASNEANQLFTNRAAMHTANGGSLVAMVLTEFVQYPHDAVWANAIGADVPNANSVRKLYGRQGRVKQSIIVGQPPADGPEALGSSDYPLTSAV